MAPIKFRFISILGYFGTTFSTAKGVIMCRLRSLVFFLAFSSLMLVNLNPSSRHELEWRLFSVVPEASVTLLGLSKGLTKLMSLATSDPILWMRNPSCSGVRYPFLSDLPPMWVWNCLDRWSSTIFFNNCSTAEDNPRLEIIDKMYYIILMWLRV